MVWLFLDIALSPCLQPRYGAYLLCVSVSLSSMILLEPVWGPESPRSGNDCTLYKRKLVGRLSVDLTHPLYPEICLASSVEQATTLATHLNCSAGIPKLHHHVSRHRSPPAARQTISHMPQGRAGCPRRSATIWVVLDRVAGFFSLASAENN